MSTAQQELNIASMRTVAAPHHYSTTVTFINEVAKRELNETQTSVDIFAVGYNRYCQVSRGDEKTKPMGPYTKRQAERIQDARRMLIEKGGTARLMFEPTRN